MLIMMNKPATNSSNTGPRPTNCNGSKSKSSKALVWFSGASYSLTSKTDLTLWIRAFLVRYYEHVAVAEEHEQDILVYRQNAKGQELIEKGGTFDFNHPENSLLTQ